jgi:MFS family permease
VAEGRLRGGDVRLWRALLAYAFLAFGEVAVTVVVTLYAYESAGVAAAGLAMGLTCLPAALLTPFLGAVGEDMPRGTRLVVSYAAVAAVLGLLTVLFLDASALWLIVVAAAVFNLSVSVARPTHYAVIPQLASSPTSLVRANSVTTLSAAVAGFAGPAFSGICTAAEVPWAVPATGAVVMAVASLLCLGFGLPHGGDGDGDEPIAGVIARIRSVAADSPVMTLLVLSGVSYLAVGAVEILSVSYAASELGADAAGQGLLVGAPALGGMVGAIVGVGVALRRRLVPPYAWGLIVYAGVLALIVLAPSLTMALVVAVVAGISFTIGSLSSETLVQRAVPDAALTRVFAVWESVMLVGYALGAWTAPVLVAWLGPRWAFVPLCAGMIALTLLAYRWMRPLDDRAVFRGEVTALLRGVAFLAPLPPAGLDRVSRHAEWLDVDDGTTVIVEGDVGDAYYVIADGRCSVTRDGRALHDSLGVGEGFGEIALMLDRPRTATVTAVGPARLLRVEREDFLAAVSRNLDGQRTASEVATAHLARDSELDDA